MKHIKNIVLIGLYCLSGFLSAVGAVGAETETADAWDITDTGQPYTDVSFPVNEGK